MFQKLKSEIFLLSSALILSMLPVYYHSAWGADSKVTDLITIHKDRTAGFSNGGWAYDRYRELEKLDAGKKMLVADLKGPGIIRHIHSTRHHPRDLFARGIVLEIWFDDADRPAVMCPLADFFGDGCNGNSINFTSNLIECAPWSYNCYFPMPFKKRACVFLRNDTNRNARNYSYVEWEPLPEWDDSLGYFHATYRRDCFQLTEDTDHMFFEVNGSGHLIGRQFSVVTDEPIFNKYRDVMEGNNEVDIDGKERVLDYLGTEDSFTFSWGFQNTFAGLRAGMVLVDVDKPVDRLSIYRFHDYMPIRFNKSLKWHINWKHERLQLEKSKSITADGCRVDFATVFYWYQQVPGGYQHQPLRPIADRRKTMLRNTSVSAK